MRRSFLIAAATLTCACTIGQPDDFGKPAELPGLNKPFRNGCGPELTVQQCADIKGVQVEFVCPFRRRVPNAIFVVVNVAAEQFDADWVFEDFVYEVEPTRASDPLDDTCLHHAYFNGILEHGYWPVVMLPTEEGCAKQAAYWDGKYCY